MFPLIYDTIIVLYTNCSFGGNCPKKTQPIIRWLLRKWTEELLADEAGKLISLAPTIPAFKSTLLFDDDSLFAAGYYKSYPVIDYSPSLYFLKGVTMTQICDKRKAIWTNSILKDEVFDTINRIWEAQHSNCQPRRIIGIFPIVDQAKQTTHEEQAKQSCD